MIDYSDNYRLTVAHKYGSTTINLIEYPGPDDWMAVKRRALITMGLHPTRRPTSEWISSILDARHSPIRRAMYSFEFTDIPSNTATHYVRHVHAQPYVSSLRTDRIAPEYLEKLRQDFGELIDSDHAPRMTPVSMILDMNAEEIQIVMNKRLCATAAELTRTMAQAMAVLASEATPEINPFLVPLCEYCGGYCHEMKPCGKYPSRLQGAYRDFAKGDAGK